MSSADESVETRRVCWAISPLNDYISIIFHEEYDHNAVIVSDFRFSLYWGRPSSRRVVKYVSFFIYILFVICCIIYLNLTGFVLFPTLQLQDGEPLCMLTPNTHSKGENIRVHVVDLTQFDFFMKSPDVNIQAICQGSDCMWTWFKTCTDMLEAMDQDSSLGLPLEDDITRDIEAQVSFVYIILILRFFQLFYLSFFSSGSCQIFTTGLS